MYYAIALYGAAPRVIVAFANLNDHRYQPGMIYHPDPELGAISVIVNEDGQALTYSPLAVAGADSQRQQDAIRTALAAYRADQPR